MQIVVFSFDDRVTVIIMSKTANVVDEATIRVQRITDRQAKYLADLARRASVQIDIVSLSKEQASQWIDRLKFGRVQSDLPPWVDCENDTADLMVRM